MLIQRVEIMQREFGLNGLSTRAAELLYVLLVQNSFAKDPPTLVKKPKGKASRCAILPEYSSLVHQSGRLVCKLTNSIKLLQKKYNTPVTVGMIHSIRMTQQVSPGLHALVFESQDSVRSTLSIINVYLLHSNLGFVPPIPLHYI